MLLRVVLLDSSSGEGVFDWIPPELEEVLAMRTPSGVDSGGPQTAAHEHGLDHGNQRQGPGKVSTFGSELDVSGIEHERLRACQLSPSSLYALLKVFIQFTRDMGGGGIRSVVFRAPMRNFEKRLLHNGVNSLEWAQSSGFFFALSGDTNERFLVGIAESNSDCVGDLLEQFWPAVHQAMAAYDTQQVSNLDHPLRAALAGLLSNRGTQAPS
mmetsp:Transcript_3553/g.7744  ORF Transcript_3553/g.7744 Transcript_3553/m.7744 type:complete len:212 (-) Transcript_3553:1015-1650(-)